MPTISYDAWLENIGGDESDNYNFAVRDFDGEFDTGQNDGLDDYQDALEGEIFQTLLEEIEHQSTSSEGTYQDVYIGNDLLDIGSFLDQDLSLGFKADDFTITDHKGVLFLHLARNLLLDQNMSYLEIFRNPNDWKWIPTEGNQFHTIGEDFENTFKVTSSDGKEEYIFHHNNGQFELVTNPRNAGSYNYFYSQGDFVYANVTTDSGHSNLDIEPWLAFGNAVNDPSNYLNRSLIAGRSGVEGEPNLDTSDTPINGTDRNDELQVPENFRWEVNGGGGNDTIIGGPQNDFINGDNGFDFVSYENSTSGVAVNLAAGVAYHGAAGYETLSANPLPGFDETTPEQLFSIEGIIGSSTGDILVGSALTNNIFVGGSGSDILDGVSDGINTAVFSGDSNQYISTRQTDGGVQIINTTTDEADMLYNIQRLQFDDIEVRTDQFLNPVSSHTALITDLGGDAGFGENSLFQNDDASTGEIDITSIFEGGINFFGREFDSLWINNNGGITFNGPRSTFTPEVITENNNNPEITPFYADVDTNGGATEASEGGTSTGSNLVYYDFDTVNDRFIVTWDDVGYFNSNTDLTNAFQLVLTDQGDGDFDIQFRYENIEWTTGDASEGEDGLGGTIARAGFTASTGDPDAYFELPASGDQSGILALDETEGNTGEIGIWEFSVRSGDINSSEIPELPDLDIWGVTAGDPHLVTLDGVAYDFHAAGEFVLLRATDDRDFEVQSRMTPVEGSENLTVNSAIALRLGGSNVMVDSTDDAPFSVDGIATDIDNFSSLAIGNDVVFRSNNVYTFVFAGEDGVISDGDSQIEVTIQDDRVDFAAYMSNEFSGNLEGLLGDGDGNADNDIAYADGTAVLRPLAFEDIYGDYRDDWRVSNTENSLFTYDESESLEGFYIEERPTSLTSLDDFSEEAVSSATETLLASGLIAGTLSFENALIDFLATGDESYIEAARDLPDVQTNNQLNVISNALTGTEGDDDIFTPLGGNDIDLLGGTDIVRGPVENFFDDDITNFGLDDTLIFEGNSVERDTIEVTPGSAILGIDTDDNGTADGSLTLNGDFSAGDFMAVTIGDDTLVTFESFLPSLQEGRALNSNLINGIINQNFLTGDGSSDFKLTLKDMGFAGFDNAIGVYEIDANGNIVDTRILYENANADKSAVAGITDVESGHRLGFFVVQDAADWATSLADSDTLSFVNSSGDAANISDGSNISLAVNGAAVNQTVFHSFSENMNSDGVQHAVSGVDVGGQAIFVGFEDLTGGGDQDYEDVVFRVETVDDFTFVA